MSTIQTFQKFNKAFDTDSRRPTPLPKDLASHQIPYQNLDFVASSLNSLAERLDKSETDVVLVKESLLELIQLLTTMVPGAAKNPNLTNLSNKLK